MAAAKAGLQRLRARALRHDGAEEGVACEGTAVERRTVKAGKKAFLFLGLADAMVKLGPSLPEARRLAKADPDAYRVGANGWVKVSWTAAPPVAVLERWIDESHGLLAGAKPKR